MILKTNDSTPAFIPEDNEDSITVFNDLVKLDRGNLICIAARPGMGKTALALHIALEYVKKSKKTVYIFSLEMIAEQVRKRMICSLAEVSPYALNNDLLSKEEKEAVERAEAYLKNVDIVIDDEPALTVERMEERLDEESNLGLVIIDYFELLTDTSVSNNRAREISEISRKLHILTKRKNIPFVFTGNLSRKIEYRKDKRPRLLDIRDFGYVEEGSDTVIFIYRDEYYRGIAEERSEAEIIIAKNRYGALMTVPLEWRGQYMRFSENK